METPIRPHHGTGPESNCPLRFHTAVPPEVFSSIERRLQLDYFKWDTQVGDCQILLAQPLLLDRENWTMLCDLAERLDREILEAETELLRRPDLQTMMGVPSALRSMLGTVADQMRRRQCVRTMRFDFHFTTEGWRISEVNSDVPGGFVESSLLPEMVAERFPDLAPAGNPLRAWGEAMNRAVGQGCIALLAAPGYIEDHQVVALLAKELSANGNECQFIQSPSQLLWRAERAYLPQEPNSPAVNAIVRFYQAEWLCRLPKRTGWENLFLPGRTLVTNPTLAVLSENKRFALVRDELSIPLPTWSALLPRCIDPREIGPSDREAWVLKGTYSNTGDEIKIGNQMCDSDWSRALRVAQRDSGRWVAQRRFQTIPVVSDVGPLYPCIGVYTINGKAAGAYARLSTHQVTDHLAREAALLIA
jgi:glutathionylspermidine synthase